MLKNKFVHKAATLASIDKRTAVAEKIQNSRFYAIPDRDFTRMASDTNSANAVDVYQNTGPIIQNHN